MAKIAAGRNGRLMPEHIVEAARERGHILHRHFEWSDEKAAQAFRLDQARSLVRSIHVEDMQTGSGVARAYYSIRDKDGTSYRSLDAILQNSDLQSKLLASAERDLLAFESRYRSLIDICDLIRNVRAQVSSRRSRSSMESRPSA